MGICWCLASHCSTGEEGALCTTTVMSGHRCIHTINMLRTVFRHLSKTHIREYAFVAVALNKSRPMHQDIGSSVGPSFIYRTLPDTSASRRGMQNASFKSKLPPQPPQMSADEKRVAVMWHAKDGIGPTAIGDRLRRSPSSISRLLSAPPDQKPTGRPRKLTKQQIDK